MADHLHEIIVQLLSTSPTGMNIHEITRIIESQQLWIRNIAAKSPLRNELSNVISHHPELFKRNKGFITLANFHPFLLANLTWNPFGWRNNTYINPRAGHQYARKNVGGESLNFNFNKKTIDNSRHVHGYVHWTYAPARFQANGLIIFYSRNTDENRGQIVGVYGKANIKPNASEHEVPFQKTPYWVNIKADKDYSMLFPYPLIADDYKATNSDRSVGQIGYTYKDLEFVERILTDELQALIENGSNETDFRKLRSIYELYLGKPFHSKIQSADEREQVELESLLKKTKSQKEIIEDLLNLLPQDPELITVNKKLFKRDNKTIAALKILRNFQCQICGSTILKKDGSSILKRVTLNPSAGKVVKRQTIFFCFAQIIIRSLIMVIEK